VVALDFLPIEEVHATDRAAPVLSLGQPRVTGGTRASNEGSRRLVRAASAKGAERTRGVPLPPEQVERRRRTALLLGLARHLKTGYHGPWWNKAEVALLGKVPDEEVARRTGRTPRAVRQKREMLGRARPPASGR
jgi:hypothetical protein